MIGSLLAAFLLELVKAVAEGFAKTMFHVRTHVRKWPGLNRRQKRRSQEPD